MKIYDVAFYCAGFFILGILFASLKLNFLTIVAAALLAAALFLFFGYFKKSRNGFSGSARLFWLAGLSIIIIIGAFYYFAYDSYKIKNLNIVFDRKINFEGLVIKNPKHGNQQQLTINLKPPYSGNILVKLQPYPSFDYGDVIKFEGTIKKPEPIEYADYLSKEKIFGVADFPKTELVAKNQGSVIQASLFRLKNKIIVNFQGYLPAERAAFLSGITLGEQAEFSIGFKQAMKNSGTTHLVALSGYNITILVMAIAYSLGYFLSRRLTFIITTLIILGFVLMVGAEASVVRAAIMGFLVLLAGQVSRLYSVRNAIVLAAFFMVLANPKVLRFDVGFQLSFLALIGIVYLSPAIQKFFKFKGQGFLGWKKNFITTTSAQLAVAPLLIINFSQFSLTAILANILILEVIPPTMFLGALLGAMGFFSNALSLILAWFANLFLSYELAIINIFAKISLPIKAIGIFWATVYYLILIGFVFYNHKKCPNPTA